MALCWSHALLHAPQTAKAVPVAEAVYTKPNKCWRGERLGTKSALNAARATRAWTLSAVARHPTRTSTASCATTRDSDPRATDTDWAEEPCRAIPSELSK